MTWEEWWEAHGGQPAYYTKKDLEQLKKDFLPGAKYMGEPRISRYLRPARTESSEAGGARSAGEKLNKED